MDSLYMFELAEVGCESAGKQNMALGLLWRGERNRLLNNILYRKLHTQWKQTVEHLKDLG